MKVPTSGTSVFAPVARTGTGTVSSTTGLGFAPDMLLGACRSHASGGFLYDKLRGVDAYLTTNNSGAEYIASGEVNSFNMDGVTFGTNPSIQVTNVNTRTYVNWNFCRAPSFFDEVCYTGTGSATTVAHNLGVAPELILFKARGGGTADWRVYVSPSTNLLLNTTDSIQTDTVMWNNTAPTSTVFSLGPSRADVNESARKYVAYLFATCAGVSKVGSYTGNGSSQTINCGFTGGARFVLIKKTSGTGDWMVSDSARGIVAGSDPYIELNNTNAEVTGEDWLDTDSTGFVVNEVSGSNANTSSATYIFLAIA
jgi:hypothetical protein